MGSLAPKGYLGVPVVNWNEEEHRRQLAAAVNNILQGKLNNVVSFTLREDATSTSVSDVRAGPDSIILPVATSLNASIALDQWYIGSRTSGSFTLVHGSTSTSDCTAVYAIFG